jgi:hypothetical protein
MLRIIFQASRFNRLLAPAVFFQRSGGQVIDLNQVKNVTKIQENIYLNQTLTISQLKSLKKTGFRTVMISDSEPTTRDYFNYDYVIRGNQKLPALVQDLNALYDEIELTNYPPILAVSDRELLDFSRY